MVIYLGFRSEVFREVSMRHNKELGAVIFNGEYPPGVFSSENPKILRHLFFPYKLDTP